jgi:DNA-binding transcriptional MocR family regulator
MSRRDALAGTLESAFGDCDLSGTTSGTHLIWRLPETLPDAQTCQALARTVGVKVNTMELETVTGPEFLPDWRRYLLLGYADLPEPVIADAVMRLANVWHESLPEGRGDGTGRTGGAG